MTDHLAMSISSKKKMGSSDDLCELTRTNDAVLLSAIEALLIAAHIPYAVTDHNVSILAGSIDAFQRRILVGECCVVDARRLLVEAGCGRELQPVDG